MHQRPPITPHRHTRAPKLAFNSLSTAWGYPRSPYGYRKRAERSHPLGPSSAPTDGWTDASATIYPSDHPDVTPSTDRPVLWNPRDLRGTVLGTRGVHKEKGQRQHRL